MSYELDFMPVGEKSSSGDAILFRFWDKENGETSEDQKICLIDGGYVENGKAIEEHAKKYYNTTHINSPSYTVPLFPENSLNLSTRSSFISPAS